MLTAPETAVHISMSQMLEIQKDQMKLPWSAKRNKEKMQDRQRSGHPHPGVKELFQKQTHTKRLVLQQAEKKYRTSISRCFFALCLCRIVRLADRAVSC